jgi:hypothetical protein
MIREAILAVLFGCTLGAATAREQIDLSGVWQCQKVQQLTYPPPSAWQDTAVPGYLSGYNYEKAWFRKSFALPAQKENTRVKLRFGGVKFNCQVRVNGVPVGGLLNGYNPFELDITDAAKPGQSNEILVGLTDWTGLFSDPVSLTNLAAGEELRSRPKNRVLAPIGGRYDLYGIWQPVQVRIVPSVSVDNVFVQPSVRNKRLAVRTRIRNDAPVAATVTISNQAWDGNSAALILPSSTVSIQPGRTVEVDTVADWTSAHLWGPRDPFLYRLQTTLETDGLPQDSVDTRFGFRELWAEGSDFFLNGTRIHLLATACWPPDAMMTRDEIRKVLSDVKEGNNAAFRLHTQPWDETWYDVADELGLLLVEEMAVWCDAWNYRLADPVFWKNYADHVRAAIERDRNHPSIGMWSLENEMIHVGGAGVFAGTEAELAKIGRLAKSLDPTRPITFEADLDPGGEAHVIGLHYPHEFPDFQLWPDTAYWMDAPAKVPPTAKLWQWLRDKPLYIGEFLWLPPTSPEAYTILYGDRVYSDPAYYRNLAKSWTWQMQIEAYRTYGVSGLCPWTMFEDVAARGGKLDLNPAANLLYQTQQRAYHPNAVFLKEYDTRFFAGETIQRTFHVFNDTLEPGLFILRCRLGKDWQIRTIDLGAAGKSRETFDLIVPQNDGEVLLEWNLMRGQTAVFSNALPCEVFHPLKLQLPDGLRLALYDRIGTTSNLLAGQGIPFTSLANLNMLSNASFQILLIGAGSFQSEAIPEIGPQSAGAQCEAFMNQGGWMVVLEQKTYPRWMPATLNKNAVNFAFPQPAHRIAQGINENRLRWWRGDNLVAERTLQMPSKGNFQAPIQAGSISGLEQAVVLEFPRGKGGLLCSQLLLAAKIETEPMAGLLFQRLLDYCAAPKPSYSPSGLAAEPESETALALGRLGLVAENVSGKLDNLGLYPLVIIGGGSNSWNAAIAGMPSLASYVEAGGKLVLHKPSDAFLAAARQNLLPGLDAAVNASFPILAASNSQTFLRNHDLFWLNDAGTWDRPAALSTNIVQRVYRKQFNLDSFRTIPVKTMPFHSAGIAIADGWSFFVNGYASQNLSVTQAGPYLFGVVARGTPALGIAPRVVLRIDGQSKDSASVMSNSWGLYTLTAELPEGSHELALAFDNDGYAPPEDRNLYLKEVRYGPDSESNGPVLLTHPGAIAQFKRGKGTILLDEICWENEGINAVKAGRLASSLLGAMGASFRQPSGLRIGAPDMKPVGLNAGATNGNTVWLYSSGRLETTVRFAGAGQYYFEIEAFGTPASGVYPKVELRIDGVVKGSFFASSKTATAYTLKTQISAGNRIVALAFVNDLYAAPEDRNLALNGLIVYQDPPVRIAALNIKPSPVAAKIIWESVAGKTYDVEWTDDLGMASWQTAGTATSSGSAASWDEGQSILSDPHFRQRFYRIKAR